MAKNTWRCTPVRILVMVAMEYGYPVAWSCLCRGGICVVWCERRSHARVENL